MDGAMIFGSLGSACALALLWGGAMIPFNRDVHPAWRIIAPVLMIPAGVVVGVGTMWVLGRAGAI